MNTAAASRPARARLGTWPHERDVAHLVLLDHQMVPSADEIAGWIATAAARGARTIRTGALFPTSTAAFIQAGFQVADRLTLLEMHLDSTADAEQRPRSGTSARLRRLRPSMLHDAATVDRRSFPAPWSNDAAALSEIMGATPQHRSRCVLDGRHMAAFSISGRADDRGYIQRLAVDPSSRRRGLATVLVADALHWMRRRHVTHAMVNTATDNEPALALYRSLGFEPLAEPLLILERDLVAT